MSPRRKAARGPDYVTTAKFLAFVVVTGMLTFFIGQQILGTSFNDRYKLTAQFDDVTGLLTGDQVKIAGTPVGQVRSIKVKQGRAVVGMAVDKDVKLPDDSTAAIRWRNVLGQRVVYLEPGQSRGMLHGGDRVPHTRSVVDLGEIVNALQPLTNNLDPNQLNRILFALSQALDGNEASINTMITNLDGLLQTFGSRKQTIQQMIKDYSAVTDAVAVRDRQIATSVDNLRDLAKVFADNRQVLDNAVVQVSGVTTNLNAVLGGNDAQLARIIDNLGKFSDTFRINVDQLEKMVQNLPIPLRQLFAATNGGHFLRTDVMCLNLVEGPCPFPMRLPNEPNNGPSQQDLAKLKSILNGGR
ncbi:MCE family protein [Actinomadura rupiterrae]|uniref:MCE family protein n=1 Tax=Actinomadura rupiterrae TaxID=559627 RepID=UPI0020A530EB|nr:MCE family protein [Actinomadura rupiterrae]MCP2334778.1 phospholipid/cholesterol/gamma-HCH transport system substrate-binding protein [Actinomadura rupiterrae]